MKRKVLVLGGGVGSMVAAFELTATPALRERFEVTVIQPGHRLGGKGASGRNMARGARIEEHGLHLWFGFYDTAFRVMRACYEELGRPHDAPLATLEAAFTPCDGIVLYDREGEGWRGFCVRWPENDGEPGDGQTLPSFWTIAGMAVGFMLNWFRDVDYSQQAQAQQQKAPEDDGGLWGWMQDRAAKLGGTLKEMAEALSGNMLEAALELIKAVQAGVVPDLGAGEKAEQGLVKLIDEFRDACWLAWEDRAVGDAGVRVFLTCLDVMAATVHGLVEDGVFGDGGSFDDINDEELCSWLRRHGARDLTLGAHPEERAPILRALYDVAFGYRDGDIGKADIAAGAAVNDLIRLVFTYRGHLAYKMQAGMGDTVFTPFYEVLSERGVRFAFFHAATRIGVDPEEDVVSEVDIVEQVGLAGEAYDPLVDVHGLPCWPSAPDWSQLEDGDRHEADGVDFEFTRNPLGREPRTLVRGKDFDDVVLGISVGGLDEDLAGELSKRSDPFRTAMEAAVTVRTQAFQLWMNEHAEDLGWEHGPRTVAGCYVEPLDTYCDMTHLLPREDGGDEVKSVGYFCGVLDHRDETHAEATERVHGHALDFLDRDLTGLWPRYEPAHLLGDGFGEQYWRANISGTELYVLSCAGTIDKRLPSDATGFANLVAAGDWTRNGIDGGCVEAAAISGVEAARALTRIVMPPPPAPPGPGEEPIGPPPGLDPPIGRDPGWINT